MSALNRHRLNGEDWLQLIVEKSVFVGFGYWFCFCFFCFVFFCCCSKKYAIRHSLYFTFRFEFYCCQLFGEIIRHQPWNQLPAYPPQLPTSRPNILKFDWITYPPLSCAKLSERKSQDLQEITPWIFLLNICLTKKTDWFVGTRLLRTTTRLVLF